MFDNVGKKSGTKKRDCNNGYTGNTDTYIPSIKEFQVLQMYFRKLTRVMVYESVPLPLN